MSSPAAVSHSKPRWERRKDARPAELLAAALELFVEKGYAGTRLDDVAHRAGVSKGTLYLYFENKEDLFKAVVRESVVERITETADEIERFEGTSDALLEHVVRRWWTEYGDKTAGGISKLMMAESSNFPEIARFFLEEVIEPWHALLATAIRRGIERGEFRAGRRRDERAHPRCLAGDAVAVEVLVRPVQPAADRCRGLHRHDGGHVPDLAEMRRAEAVRCDRVRESQGEARRDTHHPLINFRAGYERFQGR